MSKLPPPQEINLKNKLVEQYLFHKKFRWKEIISIKESTQTSTMKVFFRKNYFRNKALSQMLNSVLNTSLHVLNTIL